MMIGSASLLREESSRVLTDPTAIRLRLIGQMEAWTLTSESILPIGRKTRALLAIIALTSPRPVLRSRVAELLWSRRPEEQARASLRQEIHRLLDVLSPAGTEVLSINRDSLALRPGIAWVDVEEVFRATPAHPAGLALLSGELLDELDGVDPAFDAWLQTERERLRDRARTVAETLLGQQSDPESAIAVAQQLLSIDRTHEGAWRALMRAHAERGERGLAVQCYERCRGVLADLMDAAPSPETQQLVRQIRNNKAPAAPMVPLAEPAPAPDPAFNAESVAPVPPSLGQTGPLEPAPPTRRGGAKVGVLPLQIVGSDEAVQHLAVGLAEEITTALARFRWMFLVSSSSLAQFAQTSRDETELRRAFSLDFVLDGSVQRSGARLRVSLQLADLRDGNRVVWARRFDRTADDLLSLQDEVAAEVVAQIDPEILLIESRRAAHRPPQDATAYDLVLRAVPLISRLERASFFEAGDYLTEAIRREPDLAPAYTWFSFWHIFLVGQGWSEQPREAMREAGYLAERAITLDPMDARGLTIAGHVRAYLHGQVREALSLHERALALNPNLATAWALAAASHAYMGDWARAEASLARYKQLSPMDPHAFFYDTVFVLTALQKRDYEATVERGRAVSEINPAFSAVCKPYLAALGHLGRLTEAATVRRHLLRIEPGFTVRQFLDTTVLQRSEDKDHFAAGLRLAGVADDAPDNASGQ